MSLKALWEARCLPGLIDRVCRNPAIAEERSRWVARAAGDVVEIGIGSGLNLPFYERARVARIAGVDPSRPLLDRAAARAREAGLDVELSCAPAERLGWASGSFDTAVITFTLCSVASPRAVLGEVRRVLRPRGELVFIEHGAAPDAGPRRWQRRLTPLWRHVSGNCHLDREVRAELEGAGFAIETIEEGYTEGPRWMTYTSAGVATVAR